MAHGPSQDLKGIRRREDGQAPYKLEQVAIAGDDHRLS